MATPDDRKYSKDHEWVLLEPEGTALVGITQFAQDELGDVVFVELPKVRSQTQQFQRMGRGGIGEGRLGPRRTHRRRGAGDQP